MDYSFFTNRSQQVKACNNILEPLNVSTGCPQGCVLSTLLYSIYVESMTVSHPNMYIIKYADDTVILELCGSGQPSNLQAEMFNNAAWCENSSLLINSSKTKEIVFCNRNGEPDPIYISTQK